MLGWSKENGGAIIASGDVTHRLVVSGTRTSGKAIPDFDESLVDTSISDIEYRAEINIGTTVQTIITVGTAAGSTLAALNRLIVYNMDATNFVMVGLIVSGSKAIYLKVKPGEIQSIDPSTIDANATGGAFSAFSTVTSVTLDADTAACKCVVYAW